jgi:hypothetical protein
LICDRWELNRMNLSFLCSTCQKSWLETAQIYRDQRSRPDAFEWSESEQMATDHQSSPSELTLKNSMPITDDWLQSILNILSRISNHMLHSDRQSKKIEFREIDDFLAFYRSFLQ